MMFAQTTVEAPKYGASSREAQISVESVPAPTRKATVPKRVVDESAAGHEPARATLLGLVVLGPVLGRVARLLRRDRDLLRRDLARDDRDVDLVLVLAVDEDRRARLELAAEHEVGEGILDVALDRAAQRPGAHRRVVALLDQQLLRLVGQLDGHFVQR